MTDIQRDALDMCHNKFVGHGGVKRTVEKLIGLTIQWEHMVQHTHLFIQQCACCQKMNATRTDTCTQVRYFWQHAHCCINKWVC